MNGKGLLAWSGGKDSALALHTLKQEKADIAALLTTVTEGYNRISMHGVRRSLLQQQAEAAGCPLYEVAIPPNCPNDIYEERMRRSLEEFQRQGITYVAFGDLFLEDIRAYREERMARIGMKAEFPLWGCKTKTLAGKFVELGFRAVVVCVDTQAVGQEFAGRDYDLSFLRDLPESADPCGENGEFHSFVYDGPIFSFPVAVERGEKVLRDGRFYFCDLL